ncbi:MAG: LysR family transcriptional regulator [Lachnospiraceae bacterium]|jgi:DNA-binding transcriptional LysR family regulator
MQIEYLEEFITVATLENFSRAALFHFVSKSTLSKHIKHMENELGFPLFSRNSHYVSLTENGKIILAAAKTVVSEWKSAMAQVLPPPQKKRTSADCC